MRATPLPWQRSPIAPARTRWRRINGCAPVFKASMTRLHFPEWVRREWASGEGFAETKALVEDLDLHTVCQSARCPNMAECWQRRTATFMILGNVCTRNCRFCSVHSGHPGGGVDAGEPERVAQAVHAMGLRHAVVTSVTRDDLPDGGAGHFAATVEAIRRQNPQTTVEVLTPDFQGEPEPVRIVLEARPHVYGHNIETVRRLYEGLRGRRCTYDQALGVLETAARHAPRHAIVKSAMMAGHGETREEVAETFRDLLRAGCEVVYLGQYLRPGKKQREVAEFVRPEQFEEYERTAYELGFRFAVAGPFVRSSYRSEELLEKEFARRHAAEAGNG